MRALRPVPAIVAAVVLSGLAVPYAAAAPKPAQSSAESPRPLKAPERHRQTGRLQVRFKDGVAAKGQQAALARVTGRGHKVRLDRTVPGLNAAVLSVSNVRAVQRLLRHDPDVLYVEPESLRAPAADPASPELKAIGADVVHDATPSNVGAGAEIAILDSMVDVNNPDLNAPGKVSYVADFTQNLPDGPGFTDAPCDVTTCPHGTAVANAAAGDAGDGGMTGVAPGATIRSYNVFRRYIYSDPDTGESYGEAVSASSADIAAALTAVKNYAVTHPALVAVNLSFGSSFASRLEQDAIVALHDAAPRVTIVVAAGNEGSERPTFPAGYPYTLSVGATGQVPLGTKCSTATPDMPWTVTSFSNRGDVDVVAPGRCVNAWYPTPVYDEATGETTYPVQLTQIDGTSFASPMVAGVLAMLATAPVPVTGDAARAAISAGAVHPGVPNANVGAGSVSAPGALDVADGPAAYTAMFPERGGHLASNVGRRTLEALRVAPGAGTPPPAPAITIPAGSGTLSGSTTGTAATNVSRRRATFTMPADVNKAGQAFAITAAGGTGGADTALVPMKVLDAANNVEGLPAASGEAGSAALTYGSRSAYVRSAAIPARGTVDFDYTYGYAPPAPGDDAWHTAALYTWEPLTYGGSADAAFEPLMWEPADIVSGSNYIWAGDGDLGTEDGDFCDYQRECRPGRYLFGWVAGSPMDDSDATSRYRLTLRYANGPTAAITSPVISSTTSSTGTFTASWTGARASRFDVYWTTKSKVGTSWVLNAWKPWLKNTTLRSATFGASSVPTKPVAGQTYHFRVVARDTLGNPSLPTTKYTVVPVDDASYHVAYTPSWKRAASSGRFLAGVHVGSAAGGKITMSSETLQFTIVGDRCSTCGKFDVYVDGVKKGTVDTYRSSTAVRQPLWTSPMFSGGIKAHKIQIVNLGTKGRPKVIVDAIGTLR